MDKQKSKHQSMLRRRSRVRGKISGTAARPRLAVFRSEKHIYTQLIDDEQGVTLLSASSVSKDLRAACGSLNPQDTAKAVGEAIAERALAANINAVIFDRGGRRYAGRVQLVAEAARAKGLQF